MRATHLSDTVTKTITDRFLFTPGLSDFPEQVILVTSGGAIGGQEHEVRLTLTAPGLSSLDELRTNLSAWLGQSLAAISCDWVVEVGIEPHFDTGEPEIVVINDPQLLGQRSHDLVLAAARVYLAPIAKQNWRQVVTLRGGQRLVPLDFEVEDMFASSLKLTLPSSLELTRPRSFTIERHDDPIRYGANFLKGALAMALDGFEEISFLGVTAGQAGIVINLAFNGRLGSPRPGALNAIEQTIAEVVGRHARLNTGFFTDLVFRPARTHEAVKDDDYDEDAGWLGANREY